MPNELHLAVDRGGCLTCAPATNAEERASQCSMAWALSLAFGGDTVRVQDYLPGLHLDIQALRDVELSAPGSLPASQPVRQATLDWHGLQRRLWDTLHSPAHAGHDLVEDAELRCVIRHAGEPHEAGKPMAFTLQCVWPGVLGTWAP